MGAGRGKTTVSTLALNTAKPSSGPELALGRIQDPFKGLWHFPDQMKLHCFSHRCRNVLQVLFINLGKDHLPYAGSVGGKDLFLDSTDGENIAAERGSFRTR